MKKKNNRYDLRNIIDQAGRFQIITLKNYEINAYIITPRKNKKGDSKYELRNNKKSKIY